MANTILNFHFDYLNPSLMFGMSHIDYLELCEISHFWFKHQPTVSPDIQKSFLHK